MRHDRKSHGPNQSRGRINRHLPTCNEPEYRNDIDGVGDEEGDALDSPVCGDSPPAPKLQGRGRLNRRLRPTNEPAPAERPEEWEIDALCSDPAMRLALIREAEEAAEALDDDAEEDEKELKLARKRRRLEDSNSEDDANTEEDWNPDQEG